MDHILQFDIIIYRSYNCQQMYTQLAWYLAFPFSIFSATSCQKQNGLDPTVCLVSSLNVNVEFKCNVCWLRYQLFQQLFINKARTTAAEIGGLAATS